MKILLMMSGSIACFKAAQVISTLCKQGHTVQVVASPAALKFVGAATLEGLTGREVFSDAFQPGWAMDHINLCNWADLILLCPATANSINKLAAGLGEDVIGTLFLAFNFDRPFLIAPAMNTKMLKHPTTQKSLQLLEEMGCEVLNTGDGSLACGETGEGRLLEVDQLVEIINSKKISIDSSQGKQNSSNSLKPHVLITAGGTTEPIDSVRAISNISTGTTGVEIARTFARSGYAVTLFISDRATTAKSIENLTLNTKTFSSFSDLQHLLKSTLENQHFDVIFHAAAVSDFSVSEIISNETKTESLHKKQNTAFKIETSDTLTIKLTRNPKLIESLKSWSANKNILLIGFKLTAGTNVGERKSVVQNLLQRTRCDYVVVNDISEISKKQHLAEILNRDGKSIGKTTDKSALASVLVTEITKQLSLKSKSLDLDLPRETFV